MKINMTKEKKNALLLILCCGVVAILFAVLASIVMNRILGPVAPADPTPAPVQEIHPPVQETPKTWQISEEKTSAEYDESLNGNMLVASIKVDSITQEIIEEYTPVEENTPEVVEIATESTTNTSDPETAETPVVETPEPQEEIRIPENYMTESEIVETAMGELPEPLAISMDQYMKQINPIREEDYATYLSLIPWLGTSDANMWIDNENYDLDDPDWLPGLKVSSLTADMFTLPEWCSESTFKHIVNMIGCEGGNSQNDENLCCTAGVLYNRVFHNAYFIGKYGDGNVDFNSAIDNNLNAIGQYNPWYTTDDCYNSRILGYPQEVYDRIVRIAYLMINGYIDMPEAVVFQAEFSQGSGTWKVIHIANDVGYHATEYYCFTLGVSHE